MLVSYQQMQEYEQQLFAAGVDAAALMEEAAHKIAQWIAELYPNPSTLLVYLGKGNNAGDGILVGHYLRQQGWTVYVRRAYDSGAFKPLPLKYWNRHHQDFRILHPEDERHVQQIKGSILILDALLGIGTKDAPRDEIAQCIREIFKWRALLHAKVLSVDVPTGLLEDRRSEHCVSADYTATLGYTKKALLRDDAQQYVGRLACLSFDEHENEAWSGGERLLTSHALRPWLRHRPFDFHKGQAGRVGLIAGSREFLGAAVLCAHGALRGGAGLITLYVKSASYANLVSKLPPEIMVKTVDSYLEALQDPLDVVAMGPGLGRCADFEVCEALRHATMPVVLDADGLNALSFSDGKVLMERIYPTLLTPHPGEMMRLQKAFGIIATTRSEMVHAWIEALPRTCLLLKGSRTIVGAADQALAYNTTGSPGMATGGIGDVLTGLCAALIAQGHSVFQSACLGTWLNGRAAELAILKGNASEESLSALTVAEHLKNAFQSLKRLDD